MLTGGVVPCIEALPVKKIKLQGKYDGYQTDDFIVFVEDENSGRKAKLLAQIKHAVSITEADRTFGEVIQPAWADFQNADLFNEKNDAIALITGPLSTNDVDNVRPILESARHSECAQEFLQKINLAKFSSEPKRSKLQAFRSQLKRANNGTDLTDEQLWRFLCGFHLIGFDLDVRFGMTLALINSHIAQFTRTDIVGLFAKIAKEVESFNQNAGTITIETLPAEIVQAFSERNRVSRIPEHLLKKKPDQSTRFAPDYVTDEQANALAFASLLGSWNEQATGDSEIIQKLIEGND
jgi:hypothetical protein